MRQAWDRDPLLQCLYLDTPLLQQQNTEKLYGTKNNCACALGANSLEQILDAKDTKKTKTSTSTFEEPRTKTGFWGAKAEDCVCPLHTPPPEGWADLLSYPSSPTPGHTPTLTLCEEQISPPWGVTEQFLTRPKNLVGNTRARDFYVY